MSESGDLRAAVDRLTTTVDKLRDELVRKDVYTSNREADQRDVAALREDVQEIKETNRWLSRALVTSLLAPIASSAIIIYVVQQGG